MRREIIQSRNAPPISMVGTITRIKPATEREASETPNMDEAPFSAVGGPPLGRYFQSLPQVGAENLRNCPLVYVILKLTGQCRNTDNAASQNRRKEARDPRGGR